MPKEADGAITPDVPQKPDLNDPNVRLSRAEAMKLMVGKRRELVQNDMDPDDAKNFAATPPAAAIPDGTSAPTDDEDTSAADAAAEAERARLAKLAEEHEATDRRVEEQPALDAKSQVKQQADLVLTDDDLNMVQVPVTVNGQTRMMTGAELRATAQKVAAADTYLETAKELLREVKQGRGTLPATDPAQVQQTPKAEGSADKPATELIDEAVNQIFQGNPEEAAKLFKQILGDAVKPTDRAALTSEVEQQIVIRSALRQFAKDHKEIVADDNARRIADSFLYQELGRMGVQRLEQLDADRVPEVLDAAGRATKDYFRRMSGIAPSPSSPATGAVSGSLSERLQRKREMMGDELPAAAARASSHVPQPKTTSDVLDDMRRARGQLPRSA